MEILYVLIAPVVAMFVAIIGVNNTLNDAVDKLYSGFDSFLDKIGLGY